MGYENWANKNALDLKSTSLSTGTEDDSAERKRNKNEATKKKLIQVFSSRNSFT
jgi:hypothetical protein